MGSGFYVFISLDFYGLVVFDCFGVLMGLGLCVG